MPHPKYTFSNGDLVVYDGPPKPWGDKDERCFGRVSHVLDRGCVVYLDVIWLTPEGWREQTKVIRSHCRFPDEEELALFVSSGLHDWPNWTCSYWAPDI